MNAPLLPLAEFGWMHMAALAVLGLLLFGNRLPEIGKSLGKSVTEFKKGLAGVEDNVNINKPLPPQQQVTQQPQQPHVTAQVGQGTQQNTPHQA